MAGNESESDKIEYLSKVFKRFSAEIQENVLNTAKSLLEIQKANTSSLNSYEESQKGRQYERFKAAYQSPL